MNRKRSVVTDPTGTLVPFNYGDAQVRVVTIDGEPWFVLADLTKVLGIRQFRTDRLDDALIQNHPIRDALGRAQNATVVSEAGMYEVVIRSDKPEAAAFRRWITGTVLPSIRKTGGYQSAPALTDDEIVAQALAITTHRVKELESVVEQLTPDATAWRHLADADGNFGVADAAKMLSQDPEITIGRDRLFSFMESLGWIKRRNHRRGGWFAYQTQVDCGRLHERPATPFLNRKTGEYELPAPTIRVTAKGVAELHRLLTSVKAVA